MGIYSVCSVLAILVAIGIWQYIRVFEVYKDVYTHHDEKCVHHFFHGNLLDITRVKSAQIGILSRRDGAVTQLLSLHNIESEQQFAVKQIGDLPANSHSMYLFKNETLFVANDQGISVYSFEETNTET
jgi:hypothetical protein